MDSNTRKIVFPLLIGLFACFVLAIVVLGPRSAEEEAQDQAQDQAQIATQDSDSSATEALAATDSVGSESTPQGASAPVDTLTSEGGDPANATPATTTCGHDPGDHYCGHDPGPGDHDCDCDPPPLHRPPVDLEP